MASVLRNSSFLPSAILIFGILWVSQANCRPLPDNAEAYSLMAKRHDQWMTLHGRTYKDDTEKEKRFKIFRDNVAFIEAHNNAGNKPYNLSINEFADLTNEEFRSTRNGFKRIESPKLMSSSFNSFRYENATEIPPSMDWREMGAVTDVKNQGTCGSCWAFSVAAAIEGINKLKNGVLVPLSEQELVDCDFNYPVNQGCQGGYMDTAFKFVIQNGGLVAETDYPYTSFMGGNGFCVTKQMYAPPAAKINGYEDVPDNEDALLKAVANQPVAVAIEANSPDMRFYSGGVFTGQCGTELDHAVTVIGYGTSDDGTKFWLVKNSWGTNWGEAGYIRMQRGVSEGICGITKAASYPTI